MSNDQIERITQNPIIDHGKHAGAGALAHIQDELQREIRHHAGPAPAPVRDLIAPIQRLLQPKEPFDAKAEADRIESLAKKRIDTSNTFANDATDAGKAAAKALGDEWAKLSPDERVQTANELVSKYYNSSWDTQPDPNVIRNKDGAIVGVEFTAALWDLNMGPHSIELRASGGNVTVARNERGRGGGYQPDYIGVDRNSR